MLGRLLSQMVRGRTPAAPQVALAPFPEIEAGALVFVVPADDHTRVRPGMSLYSPLASLRLRTLPVARELAASRPVYCWPVELLSHPDAMTAASTVETLVVAKFATGDVVGKARHFEALLEWMQAASGKVRMIADLTDNYAALEEKLAAPFLGHYQAALGQHCMLTVPCEALRSQLLPIARHGIAVIEDPFESPAPRAPKVRFGDPVRLCWFGNLGTSNVDTVLAGLTHAMRGLRGRAARLQMVTHESRADMVAQIGQRLAAACGPLTTQFVPWSLEATWQAIGDCDLVLIPQEHTDSWGSVKSHNRLVETIRGGRFAVASPIPSYLELADYAWIGDDLAEGVAWALGNPLAAEERVRAGQAYVAGRFAPSRIVGLWTALLQRSLAQQAPERAVLASPELTPPPGQPARYGRPIRLHIGGRQRHPDWKILDIQPGPHVDYVGSCTDLSMLGDGSVIEIYASHVLEHPGYIAELDAALREFHRVLQPGGVLRVSVPDLTALCELFLDPALEPGEKFHVMRMMYGGQVDAADYRRVGLDQEMLGAYLARAGFVDIVRLDRFGIFDDASSLVFRNRPISLNMQCRRG